METKINITKEYYQINIPIAEVYENNVIKKFVDYLRIREIASRSQASEKDIEKISNDVNKSYWEKHKKEFIK